MTCAEVRRKLRENADAEVWRHVRNYESCVDAILSETLETHEGVIGAVDFASRITAELPLAVATRHWSLSGVAVVAGLLLLIGTAFAVAWSESLRTGHSEILPGSFAALMGVELALHLLWSGRTTRI